MSKIRKPVRTLSGVTPLAILTKPYPCPGRCAFCPTAIDMPKSYLAKEPAAARAKLSHFHPRTQIEYRLTHYQESNHDTDKIELIILGGTWSYYKKQYQTWFIKTCFDTLNVFKSVSLEEAQQANEKAKHRVIGLTIETRPDYITPAEIKRLRNFGVTRVEMGVQSVYDDVLQHNLRDHGIQEVAKATKLLKEAGIKINYHIMPNLPGSTKQKDIEMFDILFNDARFQPDMLKVYPCVLIENTLAYRWYQEGKYKPYKTNELVELGLEIKKRIPPYIRIMRFFRDIPKEYILAGSYSSNLRQMIHQRLRKEGKSCQCIRCREIKNQLQEKSLTLDRIDYDASDGKEIFLQYIDSQNRIYGFLRLRINNKETKLAMPVLEDSGIIRELHIYGKATPLSEEGEVQHKGLGRNLIKEAERITKEEFGLSKIAVISGIGVRNYYRKFRYEYASTYMIKSL